MKITPLDYARFYQALPVAIVSEKNEVVRWETVRVHQYRLVTLDKKQPKETYDSNTRAYLSEFENKFNPFSGKPGEEFKVFVKHYDNSTETLTFTAAQKNHLFRLATRAFWGKGSPEEAQITLQLAVRFGLIAANGLQQFCNLGKIGLDCNGFVGNYMRAGLGLNVGASSLINDLYKAGRPLNKVEEVDSLGVFLLGLVDAANQVIPQFSGGTQGHVMITTPTGFSLIGQSPYDKKTYPAARVVESAGGVGLVESNYLLLAVDAGGVFTVYRGSKNHSMRVRISRLNVPSNSSWM